MKSPAFQFYPSDWLSSRAVRLMDAEQRGWYIQLLAEAWESRPQASLPNDPKLLIRLAEANTCSADFESRWAFVIQQFKVKGELLINARLAKEKKKQIQYHEHRKQAGEKGAAKRWRTKTAISTDTEEKPDSSVIAEPSSSHRFANGKSMPLQSSSSSSFTSSDNKKISKPRDARLDHLALQAVREVKGRYPNKDVWDLVIKTVGEEPDVEKMRSCFVAWRAKNYAPENLGWLTDWYLNGIPGAENGRTSRVYQPKQNIHWDSPEGVSGRHNW